MLFFGFFNFEIKFFVLGLKNSIIFFANFIWSSYEKIVFESIIISLSLANSCKKMHLSKLGQ